MVFFNPNQQTEREKNSPEAQNNFREIVGHFCTNKIGIFPRYFPNSVLT
jgi:hypothetical protein